MIQAIAFVIALLILAITPSYAQEDPNKGCITVEKFVSQNADTAPVKWEDRKVLPHQVNPIRDALGVPEDANVTEIKLFSTIIKGEDIAGITFGHDGLICVYASLPPAGVILVLHILEATKGQGI